MAERQQHHTALRYQEYHEHKRWVATCSCGWVGHTFEKEAEAENDATDHVVAVTRSGN